MPARERAIEVPIPAKPAPITTTSWWGATQITRLSGVRVSRERAGPGTSGSKR